MIRSAFAPLRLTNNRINLSVLASFILTGCIAFEHHGHYKVDEAKIEKSMKKDDVLDLFGAPLKITDSENVFYYLYSQIKKSSFGYMAECETKIIRIEFKENKIEKIEVFDFKDYEASSVQTPEPNMELKLFSEILHSIGSVAGTEGIKEQQKNFKTSGISDSK